MTGRHRAPLAPRRQQGPERIGKSVEGPSPGGGPASGSAGPPPHPSDRHADGPTAVGWPRSTPWYPPSSVSNLPTEDHSARPHETSGTDTEGQHPCWHSMKSPRCYRADSMKSCPELGFPNRGAVTSQRPYSPAKSTKTYPVAVKLGRPL